VLAITQSMIPKKPALGHSASEDARERAFDPRVDTGFRKKIHAQTKSAGTLLIQVNDRPTRFGSLS
jgi:hypothetical protein